MHLRAQFRAAVAALLTGSTTAGANVFADRPGWQTVATSELPALLISTPLSQSGAPSMATIGQRGYVEQRTTVLVQVLAASTGNPADAVDGICEQVETLLAENNQLAGAKFINLEATQIEATGEAEQPMALAQMRFYAVFMHAQNAPGVAS